jgi:glucokinase
MAKGRNDATVLAGDIGGTKTNLGLFRKDRRRPAATIVESFPSQEAPGLEKIVEQFLEIHPASVVSACFGIAGPVIHGRCKATNLPWEVSEAGLKKRFDWPRVRLLNDLVATAHAVPSLQGRELHNLNAERGRKGENIALIAPGTGLGMALLVFHEGRYISVPSEGGHVGFSPSNEEEVSLWRYLRQRCGRVSVERVLSGPGLMNIYGWLRESRSYQEPAWLKELFKTMDPARVITDNGVEGKDPLCGETLEVFVAILGATAGNLALACIATGGVYLGGGIPPKILPFLEKPNFLEAFADKGRFSDFVKRIPVRVILNERAALLGAATSAFDMLQ